MSNVLHIYDNKSVMLTCEEILPDDFMVYYPCDIVALSPEVFKARPFSLIIFDVFGADKSYLAHFKNITTWIEISGATRPPILVITAMGSELTEQSARMEGADFFFVKPLDMEELVSVLKQISRRSQRR